MKQIIIKYFLCITFTFCLSAQTTPPGEDLPFVFFDDFNYLTSKDASLFQYWLDVRSGSGAPGPSGVQWLEENVTFLNDPEYAGNKLMRLIARTNGIASQTYQAEIYTPRKFLYGTYAARIKFSNTPSYGPDGDQIVETFFTITPWSTAENSEAYGECDFEYLANGGWGKTGPTLWNTSWENGSISTSTGKNVELSGWHICLIVVDNGQINYYVDSQLYASHSGIYYPETPMHINFNLWFISGGFTAGNTERAYNQDVDWVYFAKDKVLTTAQVEANIQYYKNQAIQRKDSVPDPYHPPTSTPTPTPLPTINPLKGDVNNDKKIDVIDALLIAQYSVGLNPSPFYPNAADFNTDGIIDILDALLIARYSVDL